MRDLPVIDITALRAHDVAAAPAPDAAANAVSDQVRAVAAQIDAACRSTGFFLISGHGVPEALQEALTFASRQFFALPKETLATVGMDRGGRAWRGWFPEGGELTSGRPDHKEGLYLGRDLPLTDLRVIEGRPLHGPNLLPDAELPSLRPAVDAWLAAMTALGHDLLLGVALGLGLPADWFRRHLTDDPTILFRVFRYPARPDVDPAEDGWGVGEHTDYGLLTILAHDGRPGLQVRVPGGGDHWLDVPSVPGTFVVNIGDMLDRLTGGRYRSTPHRVRHVATTGAAARDRLSFPFFFDPSWDAEIIAPPLKGSPPPDDAATRWDASSVHELSGTYGDYLTAKVAKVFPALGADVLDR